MLCLKLFGGLSNKNNSIINNKEGNDYLILFTTEIDKYIINSSNRISENF